MELCDDNWWIISGFLNFEQLITLSQTNRTLNQLVKEKPYFTDQCAEKCIDILTKRYDFVQVYITLFCEKNV